jgi:hypothetical protein
LEGWTANFCAKLYAQEVCRFHRTNFRCIGMYSRYSVDY